MAYHILLILEEKRDNRDVIHLICRALLVPLVIAQSPQNHQLDPQVTTKVISELDPTAFEYRIAQVLS